MIGTSSLSALPLLRDYRSKRASSYDRAGNNDDWFRIEPGETRILMDEPLPGCIKHIWMTVADGGKHMLRRAVVRAFWDGEDHPSIEVPLGDFFGIGHAMQANFVSLPLQMSPEDGRSMNCWWPMPFDSARIELHSQCPEPLNLYFYIDYESYSGTTQELARFHAQWRREARTEGWLTERLTPQNYKRIWSERPNLTGDDNYVILEADGDGVYVGCHLDVDCFERQGNDWYGEGDDMIFVDGEPWPPALHGTGTEDYFNLAFCPKQVYSAPFHGLTVYSGTEEWPWKGKNSLYRYHIEDPVRFRKSIRVTIEHGHANKLSNDYSSTAYWYQREPHRRFPELLGPDQRLPR